MPPNSEQPERRVDFALMKKDVADNKEASEEILRILKGYDNTPGLITRVALHAQSINRLWWWVGGISLMLLGTVGWIIRGAL